MRKYQIIYADPPWSYRSGKVQGAAQNHYPTMTDQALYQLPVSGLTDKDCALYVPEAAGSAGTHKRLGFYL